MKSGSVSVSSNNSSTPSSSNNPSFTQLSTLPPTTSSNAHHYPHHNFGSVGRNERIGLAVDTTWLQIASTAQLLEDGERTQEALEALLRHNPYHPGALIKLGHLLHNQKQYMQAAELYQKAISFLESNGSGAILPGPLLSAAWTSLAHCWLMLDELPKAFNACQQALGSPGGVRDATLWWSIGVLYDRYGADAHAIEAFGAALKTEGTINANNTNSTNQVPSPLIREIYYRLGYLLRNEGRLNASLQCFQYVHHFPPCPLHRGDICIQIALTLEMMGDRKKAIMVLQKEIESFEKDGQNAKRISAGKAESRCRALLGWFSASQTIAQEALKVEGGAQDSIVHFYLGQIYFSSGQYKEAFEEYQEAIQNNPQNAAIWNAIGVLYVETKQFKDALDAFNRAIQQTSSIADIWWNLGIVYEVCLNQTNEAIDAYRRAAELSPSNLEYKEKFKHIQEGSTESTRDVKINLKVIDPIIWMPRTILLGPVHIPPQRPPLTVNNNNVPRTAPLTNRPPPPSGLPQNRQVPSNTPSTSQQPPYYRPYQHPRPTTHLPQRRA